MSTFWEQVAGYLECGERVFVACVAEHTRGSPGTAGAKLLVAEGGDSVGTIGGGAMEHALVQRARAVLGGAEHRPERQTLLHRDTGPGERSGMVCEGSQSNVFCVLAGSGDLASVRAIAAALRDDRPAWIEIDGAGLRLTERAPELERAPITLLDAAGNWRYEEDLLVRRRLAVIGGGHCAAALAEVMAPLGYRVLIFDTRSDVVTHSRAAAVGAVCQLDDYAAAGAQIAYPALTAVVVMTADYLTDVRALLGVVDLPFPFVGLMGGRRKIARIYALLEEEGASQAALATIHAPVGLDIGSDTPEEIAISVAAQILRERARGAS